MTRRRRGEAATEIRNDLRRLRTEAGFTQEALAQLIGVTRRTIGSIERGEYVPSVTLALRLVCALGVPVERIFWLNADEATHPLTSRLTRCPFVPPSSEFQPGRGHLATVD